MSDKLLRYNTTSKFLFLDFETLNLGLSFDVNLPWQLGMLKVCGDNILDSKDILIKWDTELKISPEAAEKTRYDQSKVDSKGVKPEEAFKYLKEYIDWADYIIGHNVLGFDIYLIYEFYKMFKTPTNKMVNKFIDTNAIAKGVKLGFPFNPQSESFLEYQYRMINFRQKGLKTRLEILGQEYQIDFDPNMLHDAIYDLTLNKKVWDKLKFQVEV